MKDLINKMKKHRVDDKQAFKTTAAQGGKGKSPDRQKSTSSRPLSEPTTGNKKSKDYRIKNKVIKR